jgi:hypothetical protein
MNESPRSALDISVGDRSKVLRLSGSNFTFYGIVQSSMRVRKVTEFVKSSATIDNSTQEPVQASLAKYGFRQADFSSDWTVLPMFRGTTLEDPTLDLCNASYKSEVGREFRRQVTVSKVGTPYIFLSSEAVKYKDKRAAETALAELQANYNACVKNKGGVELDGTFVDYTFTALPSDLAPLINENSRVLVRAQIGKGESARQLLGFYQFKEEIFTGLYVVKAGVVGFSDSEVKRWLEAASIFAKRLDTKF